MHCARPYGLTGRFLPTWAFSHNGLLGYLKECMWCKPLPSMGEVPAQPVHSVDAAEELHILSTGDSSAPGMPLGVSASLLRVIT